MIRNIIFDVGAVLVDFRYHDYMLDLGFDDDTVKTIEDKLIHNDALWGQLDLGAEPEEVTIERMLTEVPGYEDKVRYFFEKNVDIVKTFDYTVPWLTELRSRGYKIYLLSNYPKKWWTLHERERFGFTHLTDGMIVSGFVKMVKPHDEIYKCLLDTYSLDPSECLFFDDRKANVEAAVRNGFNAHIFTSYKEADEYIRKSEQQK